MTRHIVIVLATLVVAGTAHAGTYHVYPGQLIQNAINESANGDEIVVHPGTYVERLDLLGKAITLRSFDGPLVTIIDGAAGGSVITCASREGPDTVIEGFTITNGYARYGGGMRNQNSSPTVNDCCFRSNTAEEQYVEAYGGGMYNVNGDPTLTSCNFSGNTATGRGGGIYSQGDPTLTDCGFSGNASQNQGAGMYNFDSNVTLTNCQFNGNAISGGSFHGGGLHNINSTLTMTNCTISGHLIGGAGAGMYNNGCTLTMTNCLLRANRSIHYEGGAIWMYDSTLTMTNCTLVENGCDGFGGAIHTQDGSPGTLTNCIVWSISGSPVQTSSTAITANYSCMQPGCFFNPGIGNIDANPLLDHALRPTFGSPCIDAGDNSAVPPDTYDLDNDGDTTEPIPLDIFGLQRFHDDPFTVDTGVGVAPIVDIGAYEYGARAAAR